jgi:4-carboxymuconolactone decarboxylase
MSDDLWEKGLEIRREVVGVDHVERSLASADDFTMPLQEYITRYAWGDVWRRPGLDRRARSILNIGMLTALNRPAELKLHLRGAVRNGVTRDEIRECLLQTAVYCGAPAALDAFRTAREVFAEMENQA